MKVHDLSKKDSLLRQFTAEIRDVNIQNDRARFRNNLERLGQIMAYELSKELDFETVEVETPLGIANSRLLVKQPVLATIMRAGLPLHQGMLSFFDHADNAFVSAYRRHHKDGSFEIHVDYISSPDLTGRPLIICDPMLATGASMEIATKELIKNGKPSEVHVVVAIAAIDGVEHIQRTLPYATIWAAAIDEELTAKSYIVPGLGDAGDLAYGSKMQD
ncbi:MAG: uracil phosphoribosyltransferase [Aureispira sp.]|nr:uracil phosphoribosyltransferase [Aureispira sp.]